MGVWVIHITLVLSVQFIKDVIVGGKKEKAENQEIQKGIKEEMIKTESTQINKIFDCLDDIINAKLVLIDLAEQDNLSPEQALINNTISIDLGRGMGHTTYINERFNPVTDIILCNSFNNKARYKDVSDDKIFTFSGFESFRGKNFKLLRRIWIDRFKTMKIEDRAIFYKILAGHTNNFIIIGFQ